MAPHISILQPGERDPSQRDRLGFDHGTHPPTMDRRVDHAAARSSAGVVDDIDDGSDNGGVAQAA